MQSGRQGELSAPRRVVGGIAYRQVKAPGGEEASDFPQVSPADGEAVRQAVFRRGPLQKRRRLRLELPAGDSEAPLALEQQETQKTRAAAQVADPEPRLQPGQGGEEKGVGAGTEQSILPDKVEAAGFQSFPVFHGSASSLQSLGPV